MPRLVAFLRAINVGGRTVTMEELRRQFSTLGYQEVETFIASGNVIFSSRPGNILAAQRKIEDRLKTALGYDVSTFVRTGAEIAAIAKYQPFEPALVAQAAVVNVGFVAEPIPPANRKAVLALRNDSNELHMHGRELYWLSKTKTSESKLSYASFEKALKTRATFRGVNTITRLASKYGFSAK